MGMKWYVDILEEIVIQTLGKNFGLNGYRSPDTGVWVQDSEGKEKKICAMGVHNRYKSGLRIFLELNSISD